jgi:uncharacterized protein (TIGR02466 family)
MIIRPVFINFIAEEQLDIDNDILVEYSIKNIGKQNLKTNYLNLDDVELKPLLNSIDNSLKRIHKEFGFSDEYTLNIDKGWSNINNNFYIDMPHCHPTYMFSVVYYAKANKNCGNLEFNTPVPAMQYSELGLGHCVKEYNAFTAARHSVPPKTGMLLIFPAWLVHNVTQNNSGEDRISFAFDVKVSGKKNQW